MNKIITIIGLMLCINHLYAQDTLYIYKNGLRVTKIATLDIDSFSFKPAVVNSQMSTRDTLYFYKSGSVFKSKAIAEIDSINFEFSYDAVSKLLTDMYSYPVPLNFDTRNIGQNGTRLEGGTFASALTDEGLYYDSATGSSVGLSQYYFNDFNLAWCTSWNSPRNGEDDYLVKWETIRKAYLLLENVDRVPDSTFPISSGISVADAKARIKDEAKLMIALVYFEIWKRYGGVPIVTRAFSATDSPLPYCQQRATLEETYQFISGLLDEVMGNAKLPARITVSSESSRFPLALAYGLKARLELYAASPLYNTATPYSTALGLNSNLICFMNYDKERWKKAADAATAAIDYCEANGYGLVDNPSSRDNAMNYTLANIESPANGNTEMIWGIVLAQYQNAFTGNNWSFYNLVRGCKTGTVQGQGSNQVPLNQVERYELKTDIAGQFKSWDGVQSYDIPSISSGATLLEGNLIVAAVARKPYLGLDPRFVASVAHNGISDEYNDYGLESYLDMADAYTDNNELIPNKSGKHHGSDYTLSYVRKFNRGYEFNESLMTPINIYMRLAELHLIRAEALNEYSGPQQQVYDDLNRIRSRSGMSNVKTDVPQTEMRETIVHERSIEFFYEDQRWFDLRRTLQSAVKIPVSIYKPEIKKWYHTTTDAWPYKITYEKVLHNTRVWNNKMYMNPFPSQEVAKGYGLIQNPEW